MIEKIVNVERDFRTGNGKKGPWSLHKIELESGKKASTFDDVQVGDTVEVFKKGEYWNAKKTFANVEQPASSGASTTTFMAKDIKVIRQQLDRIEKMLSDNVKVDSPVKDVFGEPEAVDLSDIPY